jgi:hypothetical protein
MMASTGAEEEEDPFSLFDIDVDTLREPSSCLFYCDPCKTMFTTSGLKKAQSAKGYRHKNSLRELGETAKSGTYFPRCALCELIVNEMDSNNWAHDDLSVIFFLALNNKEHRLEDSESDLMSFDGIIGYLFDEEDGSYFPKALVKLVAIADDGKLYHAVWAIPKAFRRRIRANKLLVRGSCISYYP